MKLFDTLAATMSTPLVEAITSILSVSIDPAEMALLHPTASLEVARINLPGVNGCRYGLVKTNEKKHFTYFPWTVGAVGLRNVVIQDQSAFNKSITAVYAAEQALQTALEAMQNAIDSTPLGVQDEAWNKVLYTTHTQAFHRKVYTLNNISQCYLDIKSYLEHDLIPIDQPAVS